MTSVVSQHGETQAADIALCVEISRVLQRQYPGHQWLIGADSVAGVATIDLPYAKPHHLRNWGYVLHISSMNSAGADDKVMRAGGELLERFGLSRARSANENTYAYARENGIDVTGGLQ